MLLKENETVENLGCKDLKLIQNKRGFCFGIDGVLLANFAKNIKKDSIVMDMGTGTGIIATLLCGKTQLKKIYGIEVQEEVAEMAKRSIQLNQLEEKFTIIQDNIKNLLNYFKKSSMDVIITNPPYKKIQTGIPNGSEKRYLSRHEVTASLEEFIQMASILLKPLGEFYMVHRPERLIDITEGLRKNNLEPKEMTFVYPKIETEPNLLLIRAIKGGKPFLRINKPYIVYRKEQKK